MLVRHLALISLLLASSLLPATAFGAESERLKIRLETRDELRPLLEQHLHLLRKDRQTLPAREADRSALVRRARREVEALLKTEGYFSPTVKVVTAASPWLLQVEPGPRTRISAVHIEIEGEVARRGEQLPAAEVTPDRLRASWSLPPGEPFRQESWDHAKQGLLDALTECRYAAARIVDSRAEIDPLTAEARLRVKLDSGPSFYLGALEVSGIEELPVDLVQRYSRLEEGDLYDREKLLAFQTNLQNTPHFAAVIVDIERDPALASAVPVRVQVTEARPKYLGFGVGVSSNTGFRVEASYRDANLFRRGWELGTGLRLEQRRQSAYADIFLPPSGRHRDSMGAMVDRSNLEGLKVVSQTVGVARTTHRGNIETQLALRMQHEKLQPSGAPSRTQETLTANWTWIQRKVDDLLDPRSGHILEFQAGGGAAIAFAKRDFVRTYARAVRYQTVRSTDVFILRADAGITVADARQGIPQDFLFRTGGAQTVRGYAYQSLGVKEGRATVGGRYLATMSAEYVHWMKPDWGVAAFIDTGDAADTRRDFDLRTGYGLGGRWRSPAGPLALDFAWSHDDHRLRMHFSVAVAF